MLSDGCGRRRAMSATYPSRIQRLRRLQGKLPRPGTPEGEWLIITQLLVAKAS